MLQRTKNPFSLSPFLVFLLCPLGPKLQRTKKKWDKKKEKWDTTSVEGKRVVVWGDNTDFFWEINRALGFLCPSSQTDEKKRNLERIRWERILIQKTRGTNSCSWKKRKKNYTIHVTFNYNIYTSNITITVTITIISKTDPYKRHVNLILLSSYKRHPQLLCSKHEIQGY